VKRLKNLWHDEDGLTTVEYALLLVALVLGGTFVWTALRGGTFVWTALRGTISDTVDLASNELGNS